MGVDWQGKPVVVTGAAGFIGSHLVECLTLLGARVRAFCRYNSRGDIGALRFVPEALLRKVEVVFGDLRDHEAVDWALEGAEIVFHLGALIAIPYSYVHPREVVETNMLGTLNVLLAARARAVSRIVHTSSSEVYGTAVSVPMDERHQLHAQSPYAASKTGADQLALSFYHAYGLPVSVLRPFNAYGPRQSARAVVPTIITQALSRNEVVLGNLHPTRDLTYVADTVEAFLKIASCSQAVGHEVNIGTGEEIGVETLFETILGILGKGSAVRLKVDQRRVRPTGSEVERLCCDNRKAKSLLGWSPRTLLVDGLKETVAWIKGNLSLYSPDTYQL